MPINGSDPRNKLSVAVITDKCCVCSSLGTATPPGIELVRCAGCLSNVCVHHMLGCDCRELSSGRPSACQSKLWCNGCGYAHMELNVPPPNNRIAVEPDTEPLTYEIVDDY